MADGHEELPAESGDEADKTLPIETGNVLLLPIEDEIRTSYLTYAMSVIISRALPDVRDGLKPSQRRILVAMRDLNLGPSASRTNRPFKSAPTACSATPTWTWCRPRNSSPAILCNRVKPSSDHGSAGSMS